MRPAPDATPRAALTTQSPESFFCHVPGVRVVVPATPSEAKGLLLAAVRCPDPVVFLEPKMLYRWGRRAQAGMEIAAPSFCPPLPAGPSGCLLPRAAGFGVIWHAEACIHIYVHA